MAGGFRSRTHSARKQEAEQRKNSHAGKLKKKRARPDRRSPEPGQDYRRDRREHSQRHVKDPVRSAAWEVIVRVHTEDAFANLILPKILREQGLRGRDAAFATEITYGTLRHLGQLDRIIEKCSARPLKNLDAEVLAALQLGAYQLFYTRVDDHAAVDTTVTLVAESDGAKARGFSNAVMRSMAKHPLSWWIDELTPLDEIAALAFRHAHPEWIVRSFARVLGDEEVASALRADSQRPQVHLVARPGEATAEEIALMTGGDVGPYAPTAVRLPEGTGELEVVRDGLAGVQDEGSQLIARAAATGPVDGPDQGRWLDLCAGPGGKTALMAAYARVDGAKVDAVEVAPHRARLVEQATADYRDICRVYVDDGRKPGSITGGYDRVLVDAPCSGLGSLRRRPEARWRKQESDIAELNVLQRELLDSAIRLTRPGGLVVYSTCSPDLRETRDIVDAVVAAWASTDRPVTEIPAAELLPTAIPESTQGLAMQLWPHRHGTDAMFMAALRVGGNERPILGES